MGSGRLTGRPKGSGLIHRLADHADAIVAWLSEGKTLREYCRQEGAPCFTTVYTWRDSDPGFAVRFARAREIGFDAIAEEALAIADTPVAGEIVTVEGEGDDQVTKRTTEDMLGHRKLQFEARLKLLAKWSPRYAEKLAVGGDPNGAPIRLLSVTERAHRLQAIVHAAAARVAPPSLEASVADDLKELGL